MCSSSKHFYLPYFLPLNEEGKLRRTMLAVYLCVLSFKVLIHYADFKEFVRSCNSHQTTLQRLAF